MDNETADQSDDTDVEPDVPTNPAGDETENFAEAQGVEVRSNDDEEDEAPLQQTSTERRRNTKRNTKKMDDILSNEEILQQAQGAAEAIGGDFVQGEGFVPGDSQEADGQGGTDPQTNEEAQEQTAAGQQDTAADNQQDAGTQDTGEGDTQAVAVDGGQPVQTREETQQEEQQAGTATGVGTGDQQDGDGLRSNIQQQIQQSQQEAQQEIQEVERRFNNIKTQLDSASKSLLEGTKENFRGRIKEMKEKNERLLQTVETRGVRTGRSRYTPQMQQSIITDQERENIARIQKLRGKMLTAVAEAQRAKAEKSMEVFNSRMDQVRQIEQNMQEEVQSLYDKSLQVMEEQRLQNKEERKQEQQEFDQGVEQSKEEAPAVADTVSGMENNDKIAEFINMYADRRGLDPEILYADVVEQLDEQKQEELDRANTRSQIQSRQQSDARQAAQEGRAQQEQQREQSRRQLQQRLTQWFVQKQEDGEITREDYESAKETWVANGFSGEEFDSQIGNTFFDTEI